ncbi:hypothetical protein, partial [Marinobacter salarius]|uniref:hypothetical protein n=1 Tax=Marinobacter salarius TaxID=1420917 RepID=UPI001D1185F9
ENGLSGVLAIRSGILGSIHRQLNLKHPNATNPGKPGFVSNLRADLSALFFDFLTKVHTSLAPRNCYPEWVPVTPT